MTPPLTSSDRRLLAALAVRVLEAQPDRRQAIVDEATAGRPDLRVAFGRIEAGARSRSEDGVSPEADPIADLADLFERAASEALDIHPDLSGTTMGRYRLIRRLGLGAFGAVYLAARSRRDARPLALKVLHPGIASPRSIRRFIREQRVLASLDHPGVARLVAAGEGPNRCPYFVMELIDGPSLRSHCRRYAPPLVERVRLMAQVCDALQHVHEKGVVHRDLKPGNILVPLVDGRPRPIVIDFGVVRLIEHAPEALSTTQGRRMGTPRYMSPEQRTGGTVDGRSDIYSLGVTMAEILAESPAARARTSGSRRGARPSMLRVDGLTAPLPTALRHIIDRCTRVQPAERYPTVAELADDLRRFMERQPTDPRRGPDAT